MCQYVLKLLVYKLLQLSIVELYYITEFILFKVFLMIDHTEITCIIV